MAYAEYYIETAGAAGTTSVTIWGVAANWRELPDHAVPIAYIDTSTPGGLNTGVYIEFGSSSPWDTSGTGSTSVWVTLLHTDHHQVSGYKIGSRWFRCTTAPNIANRGEGLWDGCNVLKLYYRSVNEGHYVAQ